MADPPVSLADWLTAALDAEEAVSRYTPSIRGSYDQQPIGEYNQFRLADIAAKRAIIDEHAPSRFEDDDGCCVCYLGPNGAPYEWPCRTLRLLAQPYKDRHPGWRDEWDVT